MAHPQLTFTTGRRYDTRFLLGGEVQVRGFDIAYTDAGPAPWPQFLDMVTKLSYDIGEQAFSHYLIAKDQGKPLTAIPVFVSRFFPQIGARVHRDSGIREPADLVGKRAGVLGFGYNPAAWMRGILVHQYDVPVERIIWVEDADDPMFAGLAYPRSRRYTVERAQGVAEMLGQQPIELLETGQLDALIAPSGGPPLTEATRRLFEDPIREIRAYVAQTGVFPINTLITLKESVVAAHPELPARLMEAFRAAKLRYQADLLARRETNHMGVELTTLQELGLFPDQYGVEPNRAAIRMMIQYCYEQGLIRTLYEPEDLFVQ